MEIAPGKATDEQNFEGIINDAIPVSHQTSSQLPNQEEAKVEVDANDNVPSVSEGQEGNSQAQVIAGGEILSQENDVHEYHAQGDAQAVAVEVSDPIEEEVK